jgi:pimeloyl-ACP methyl ester carboxylesterase
MRAVRLFGAAVALALVGAGGFVLMARVGMLRPDEGEMRARYGLPTSQFVKVGEQNLHLVDEGSGPPVILVHGSFASLRMWQQWADALKGRYRVIRFDRPGMGLSGPNPDGRYDGDAEAALIGKLADQMKLDRFFLVGTSSSGEGVAHFAAIHPERLRGVVLSNIAAGPMPFAPVDHGPWFKAVITADPWFKGWHPQALWCEILAMNFADPSRISPGLVREWTELNNRAQGWPRKPRAGGLPPFAGTPADLKAISVPTLLLWSDKDPEVPLARDGRNALAWVGAPDKALKAVPDCGHMMPQECGPQSVAIAGQFLDRVAAGGK